MSRPVHKLVRDVYNAPELQEQIVQTNLDGDAMWFAEVCVVEAIERTIGELEMMGGGGTFSDTSGYIKQIRLHFGMEEDNA